MSTHRRGLGRIRDALSLLRSAAPVSAPYSLAYDVEFSRALMQTGQNERALDRLTTALGKALMGEQPSPGVDAATACRAVVLMGRAHMSLGEYGLAETVARLAVNVLEAEDADELSLDVSLQVGGSTDKDNGTRTGGALTPARESKNHIEVVVLCRDVSAARQDYVRHGAACECIYEILRREAPGTPTS